MSESFAGACARGDTRSVRAALRRGADPNRHFRGRTPLNWAAQEGRDAVVAILLAAGADPNGADAKFRVCPLHTAAGAGHVRIVRRLLRAGADPNSWARGMGSPLHLAASFGHLHCVRALARAGANISQRDAEGVSAVEYAQRYSRTEVVVFLNGLVADAEPDPTS